MTSDAVRREETPSARTDPNARIATLKSALAALIARVRRTGGYATPEEQDVLRAAEQALTGEAEKASGEPVVSAEALGRDDGAGEPDGRSGGRSGGGR